ncbi:MAG TPA: ABC transporter substrate-binding protein [Candidatus Binatia bacterium]|nr:ABC transporter substrate-binding protein [Candidatus Binatia bacterium]
MSLRGVAAVRGGARPSLTLIALALLGVLLGAATATAQDADYRKPLGNDPSTLDPARISDVYGRPVAQQIFDGLVAFDQTLAITPALAEHWTASRDGLTWTFTLRKGVRFHHGREVTADDVVFSFMRILDPRLKSSAADVFWVIKGARDYAEGRARTVSGLVALDPRTVQFTLAEAFAPFVTALAVGHAKIVPRDVVEAPGSDFGSRPIGTGPFRFVSWERGRSITLAANREYFGGAPRLGRVIYRIFPGEPVDAMYAEFLKGNLEESPVPTQNHAAIVSAPGRQYVRRPLFNLRFYGLNVRVKPLDDRRVRQAIVHAVDRAGLIQTVFQGRYHLAQSILPLGTLGYNPAVRPLAYDPDRARKLLAEAGYPGGAGLPPVTIWSSVRSERLLEEHARIVKSLAAVGIRARYEYQTDWPVFSRLLADGKPPMFLYSWNADIPDPDNFLYLLFHSRSPRNYTGYANPAVDNLLLTARNERDPQRRVELYHKAEQLIIDDAPVLPMWHYIYERLFQPSVKSIEVNGLGDPYIPLRKIWMQ